MPQFCVERMVPVMRVLHAESLEEAGVRAKLMTLNHEVLTRVWPRKAITVYEASPDSPPEPPRAA